MPSGILIIDKPAGWTSMDVCAKLRGVFREKRVGHGGTLDPMATGVLPIFVGQATRAVEFAENGQEEYVAGLRLGQVTNTQDIWGETLEIHPVSLTAEQVASALAAFRGDIAQVPPMYSAVKVNGERLYKLARRGETVERAARPVTVHALKLLGREGEDWILEIRCSKGTYIRTLCQDIGDALGCGGCMAALRRLEAGCFTVEEAHTLPEIAAAAEEGRAEALLLPSDTLFRDIPARTLDAGAEKKVRNGNPFPSPWPDGTLRLYAGTGEFLALARAENGECRTIKSFFEVNPT